MTSTFRIKLALWMLISVASATFVMAALWAGGFAGAAA